MILYSVTCNIDPAVHDDWFAYMKTKHIPDVLASGCFCGHKMYQILTTQEEGELSYSIQYFCNSMDEFNLYQQQFAKKLQAEHSQKFGDKVLAFRTLLETV